MEVFLFSYILSALVNAVFSYTICCTGVFKPIRVVISSWGKSWEEWIHCPFCLSYCPGIILTMALADWKVFNLFDVHLLDFFVNLFILQGMTAIIHFVILRAYEPVAKMNTIRKIEQFKKTKS